MCLIVSSAFSRSGSFRSNRTLEWSVVGQFYDQRLMVVLQWTTRPLEHHGKEENVSDEFILRPIVNGNNLLTLNGEEKGCTSTDAITLE